jgi:hypothetical protein
MPRPTTSIAFLLAAAFSLPAFAQDVRLINGFNADGDLALFSWSQGVRTELVREHVAEGACAVQVTFPGGSEYAGFGIKDPKLMAGWENFDLVTFDVFNPSGEVVTLTIRIDDDRTNGGDDYSKWYTGSFKAFPGANRIEIELAKLTTPRFGKMNVPKLRQFVLWTNLTETDKTLVFDSFALRKFEKVALPKGMLAFDFGGEKSNVMPGFTLVTEKMKYDDARGFGFTGNTEVIAVEDAPRAAEPLGQDAVSTWEGAPLQFAVKLADGKYHAWAATGYVDQWNWPRKPYRVTANGKEVSRWAPKTLDFRQASDPLAYEYRPEADLWKMQVVGHLFDEWEAEVDVTGGKLELVVATEGVASSRIRGLAIWPAGDAACAKAMADVNAKRVASYNRQWREIRPRALWSMEAGPTPQPPIILRTVNYLTPISPYCGEGEPLERLSVKAAPGQTEPAVFLCYPLSDVRGLRVSVSDLAGGDGVVRSDCIRVFTVQLRYTREGEDGYSVEPVHLVPRNEFDLERRVQRQVWMNVRVPEDAKPGTYAGKVTVSAGGESREFPLELEVYPFNLDRPEDHGIVYAHAYSCGSTPAEIEMDLRCLQEHGSNSVTPGGAIGWRVERKAGKLVFDFSRLDMLMDVMKKLRMKGPVPLFDTSVQGEAGGNTYPHLGFLKAFGYKVESQAYLDDLTELTRQLVERAKEKDYLPILMYPSTEVSNDPDMGPRFNSKLIAAMRKAGKVECISSVNHPEDVATAKELDHVMINFGVGINDGTLKRIRESGAKLWFQNVGQTRYTDGLFMLRAGAVGRRQWVAGWWTGDPYSDWDGMESNSLIFPSPTETLPSIKLEWMSQGVNDLRYFLTLKRLIGEARKAGHGAEADAAQKAYDEMIASCPVQLPDGTQIFPDGLSVIDGFSDKGTFDRYRQRAAEEIVKLMKATGNLR